MSALRKNVASQVITFCLVNATTGAALTGATVTTKVALDGTQSASAGTLTELGSGQYKYVPTAGETNGASVGFLFTATNAVPVNLHVFTTSNDPATVIPTAADNAGAVWDEARAGHVTAGSFGENVIADITKIGGNAASISPTAGLLNARLTEISVSGAVALGVIQNGNVVAGVTNPVAVNSLANNVVTAAALDSGAVNEIADGLLDRTNGIDIGLTPRHALELAAASVLQKLSGAGTGTERVRNFADTADLATVTVDGAGNKSAIIYDFSI